MENGHAKSRNNGSGSLRMGIKGESGEVMKCCDGSFKAGKNSGIEPCKSVGQNDNSGSLKMGTK